MNITNTSDVKQTDFKYKNKGVDIDITTEINKVFDNSADKTFTLALGNRDGEEPPKSIVSLMGHLDQNFKVIPVDNYLTTCSLDENKKITCDNEDMQKHIYHINY